MKMGFIGQVNTEDMRLFFHKTAQSTVENETPEELEKEQLEKQKELFKSKAEEAFKRKPDSKGGER